MSDKLARFAPLLIVLGALLALFAALPVAATDNAKWFVCKYTGTPGVDEVLQLGDNPISVSENAIPVSPVAPGTQFSDSQGRSIVLVEDTGQVPEPDADDCPPPNQPTPTPLPSLSPSPSSSPGSSPSTQPSQPIAAQFSVEVCPATGEPVAAGQSQIRFRHPVLLLLILNVRIDGELVTLIDTLGDGTVGDAIVAPGVHSWSISNAADTEVLASGEVDCPECNPASPSADASLPDESPAPPPPPLEPPVPDTALPAVRGAVFWFGIAIISLGGLLLYNALSVARRRR